MELVVPALTGLLSGAVAHLLAPWMRRVAGTDSRWLHTGAQVVLAAGLAFGGAALAGGWVERLAYAALAVACGLLVVIDLAVHRLPDVIVAPAFLVLLLGLTVTAATDGSWMVLGRALLAAAGVGLALLVLAWISPAGLGLGDVKLAALLGALLGWQGWPQVLLGMAAAFVVNGAVVGLLLLARRIRLGSAVAFGPSLVAGTVLGAATSLW